MKPGSKAKRCDILAAPVARKGQTLLINTFPAGQTWRPTEPEAQSNRYMFTIPTVCTAIGALHRRTERCAVSGF